MSRIQKIVDETNVILNTEKPSKQVLAVGVEINQKYIEYLEWLEEQDLSDTNGVTVVVDCKTVRFLDMDSFSRWVAEHTS